MGWICLIYVLIMCYMSLRMTVLYIENYVFLFKAILQFVQRPTISFKCFIMHHPATAVLLCLALSIDAQGNDEPQRYIS